MLLAQAIVVGLGFFSFHPTDKVKEPLFKSASYEETVRNICTVYEYLLQNEAATTNIPTFYEYIGLEYKELASQSKEEVQQQVWKSVERFQVYLDAEYISSGWWSGETQHDLSTHEIRIMVSNILLDEKARNLYNNVYMGALEGGLLSLRKPDRFALLKSWCYTGWGEKL
ncbi:hypothetical protein B0T19DRAFT_438310 [Cercophora scortea]|uniref:Uncharacterized protein n=1 Tax=Cercophora scortea TaxID=314031 RepID=A0AAE0J658_9PEZI|nr:hypothetical protein B0T19DRAFT_438310 [Cercophora scortea]